MWNTPKDPTDAELADLIEREQYPRTNPETLASGRVNELRISKRVVDLRRSYDLHFDYQTAAPVDQAWSCVDLNSYDGAPDSQGVSTYVGRGPDRRAAMLDLLEQFGEFEDEQP